MIVYFISFTLGETVVTDAGHMSKKWTVVDTKQVTDGSQVGDLVEAGGEEYNVFTDNCHHASERMMELGSGDEDDN